MDTKRKLLSDDYEWDEKRKEWFEVKTGQTVTSPSVTVAPTTKPSDDTAWWKRNHKACIHAPKLVYRMGKGEVWAGARMDVNMERRAGRLTQFDLVLNCTGDAERVSAVPDIAVRLMPYMKVAQIAELTLPWEDFKLPPVDTGFWYELADMVRAGMRVLVYCVGSHGRTGTALSSLLVAGEGLTGWDAIRAVRRAHCDQSVETKDQEKYIVKLAEGGRPKAAMVTAAMTAAKVKVAAKPEAKVTDGPLWRIAGEN